MAGAECVIFAFGHLREAADTMKCPQGMERFFPSGQYFMCISLVAYIKDHFIIWGVEHIMNGH